MPTYAYACKSCEHEFDQFQSMKDDHLKVCPACGKKTLKRLVGGGAGLIFKGTGFYITDYKKKTGGETKTSETKTADAKPSAGDTKTSATPSSTPAKPAATPAATK